MKAFNIAGEDVMAYGLAVNLNTLIVQANLVNLSPGACGGPPIPSINKIASKLIFNSSNRRLTY